MDILKGTRLSLPTYYGGYFSAPGYRGVGLYATGGSRAAKFEGSLDVNGSIYQRGNQLHADYVFEPGYELQSIDEHSEFMWQHKHLAAIPKVMVDGTGQEIVDVGTHRKGIVEELEKAHIYIEQLHNRIKALEENLARLEAEHSPAE